MRRLFVPACLCFMTWSGTTAIKSQKLSFEEFFRVPGVGKNADASQLPSGAESDPAIEIPQNNLAGIQVPLPPIAKPVVHRSRAEVCDTLEKAAQTNDLPMAFFIRLLLQESGFQPEVVSTAGAQGVAQFMPEVSASVGLENPFDPAQAIPASARLLRELHRQFGNLGLAAAAYNAGPKRIQDWLAKKGGLPEETKGYVKTITGRSAESWKAAQAGRPDTTLPRHAPCREIAATYASVDTVPLPTPAPVSHPTAVTKKVVVHTVVAADTSAKPHVAASNSKVKTAKPVVVAAAPDAKNGKGAVQLAARSTSKATNKATSTPKPGIAPQKNASKPVKLAAAESSARK